MFKQPSTKNDTLLKYVKAEIGKQTSNNGLKDKVEQPSFNAYTILSCKKLHTKSINLYFVQYNCIGLLHDKVIILSEIITGRSP